MGHLLQHRSDGPDHQHSHGGHGEHGYEHPSGRWATIQAFLSETFGAHTHDVADQIDDALEADSAGRRALRWSLVGLAATATVQAVVVAATGSIALLGDTLHNFADALTAVPLLIAFALGRRAANDRFTYGYGRAEDIAGLFVVAMITLSSVLAAYEAITRLLNPHAVSHLWAVAVAAVIGFAGNEWVARHRIKVGRRIGSAALVADGLHARTDGFTSLAVLLSAGGVALGWQWADPAIGLVITIAILGVLRTTLLQVGARLMDAVDPHLVANAKSAIASVEEVLAVRDLRLRWIGHTLHAEADVVVDSNLTIEQAHEVAHHTEAHLISYIGRLSAATVHVSPSGAHAGMPTTQP